MQAQVGISHNEGSLQSAFYLDTKLALLLQYGDY